MAKMMTINERHTFFHWACKTYGLGDIVMWDGNIPWTMTMKHHGPRRKYMCGQLPPRYPVPAIPIDVVRSRSWLLILHKTTRHVYQWWHLRRDGYVATDFGSS